MTTLLFYGVCLMIAVLISGWAQRTIASTAVLFLVAGVGGSMFGLLPVTPDEPLVARLAESALVAVLFSDGAKTGVRDLATAWRLPGRALLFGMPLTAAATALLARYLVGLPWLEAMFVGAALSPTDPVFAAALVGSERVPRRLRELLNVESGLNDGLAVPAVVLLLGTLGAQDTRLLSLLGDIGFGILLGIGVPLAAVGLARLPVFSISPLYRPLFGLAVLLVVYPLAAVTGVNEFLAAFAAGVTVASLSGRAVEHFRGTGERLSELLKLAAILVFGALVSGRAVLNMGWSSYLFAALALFVARPVALNIALLRSALSWKERLVAAWFGPKGFASVVFALMVLRTSLPGREQLFHLVALVVAASILVHSSSDVFAARWLTSADDRGESPDGPSHLPDRRQSA